MTNLQRKLRYHHTLINIYGTEELEELITHQKEDILRSSDFIKLLIEANSLALIWVRTEYSDDKYKEPYVKGESKEKYIEITLTASFF